MKINYHTLKHLFLYGIFGVLTTILAIFLYWAFTRLAGFSVVISSALSWLLAVLFAYVKNKLFVFNSHVDSWHKVFLEAYSFFMARALTGVLDIAIMFLFVEVLKFYDMPVKIISNIIVIVLNYVASKLFIFREAKS